MIFLLHFCAPDFLTMPLDISPGTIDPGWDRTPQITSIAMLFLDSFYRTFEGFCFLVRREWALFGHKFADRLQYFHNHEASPVFVQFLDCTWQIMQQCPAFLQFNEELLEFLCTTAYSRWFPDFCCNTSKARSWVLDTDSSVWSVVAKHREAFINPLFGAETHSADVTQFDLEKLRPWHRLFRRGMMLESAKESEAVQRHSQKLAQMCSFNLGEISRSSLDGIMRGRFASNTASSHHSKVHSVVAEIYQAHQEDAGVQEHVSVPGKKGCCTVQ